VRRGVDSPGVADSRGGRCLPVPVPRARGDRPQDFREERDRARVGLRGDSRQDFLGELDRERVLRVLVDLRQDSRAERDRAPVDLRGDFRQDFLGELDRERVDLRRDSLVERERRVRAGLQGACLVPGSRAGVRDGRWGAWQRGRRERGLARERVVLREPHRRAREAWGLVFRGCPQRGVVARARWGRWERVAGGRWRCPICLVHRAKWVLRGVVRGDVRRSSRLGSAAAAIRKCPTV
jgi:hypothetical protein